MREAFPAAKALPTVASSSSISTVTEAAVDEAHPASPLALGAPRLRLPHRGKCACSPGAAGAPIAEAGQRSRNRSRGMGWMDQLVDQRGTPVELTTSDRVARRSCGTRGHHVHLGLEDQEQVAWRATMQVRRLNPWTRLGDRTRGAWTPRESANPSRGGSRGSSLTRRPARQRRWGPSCSCQ